jgi:hypothetical protein
MKWQLVQVDVIVFEWLEDKFDLCWFKQHTLNVYGEGGWMYISRIISLGTRRRCVVSFMFRPFYIRTYRIWEWLGPRVVWTLWIGETSLNQPRKQTTIFTLFSPCILIQLTVLNINNKCTFGIYVTLLPYTCFGCGPAIIRGTLVGSLHWHWFIWYYHKSSQCFCSFCSLSSEVCVRLASKARDITVRVAVYKAVSRW